MTKTFTTAQFIYWLETMDISYEEAAKLLKTDIKTIVDYAMGFKNVSYKHATECYATLRMRKN
jgi:hypothetical protein